MNLQHSTTQTLTSTVLDKLLTLKPTLKTKSTWKPGALLLAFVSLWSELSVAQGTDTLKLAEQYKVQAESARIDCDVELYQDDKLEKTRQYQVYAGKDNQSLVLFKSNADAGQKVLINGKDFWLLMPKSRRPMRITPMQKLLGEASLGDVATLSWSKDYQVVAEVAQENTITLELHAQNAAASYQRISLTVNAADQFPLTADLYLRSGVLAKTASFSRGHRDGKPAIVAMSLQDQLQPHSKTVIHYKRVTPVDIPAKVFNPQVLLRADVASLLGQ